MKTYNVLNKLVTAVTVTENPYQFELEQLFEMAMRINKKRSFLFVSHVLGKHLAVAPQVPILIGHLLAHRFANIRQKQELHTTETLVQALKRGTGLVDEMKRAQQEPILSQQPLHIIGFAETATALGHAFFDAFMGDVRYIHTTREQLLDKEPLITFEEEHSHATSHRLYADAAFFEKAQEVVLVDDEMTTGKTNRNIIEQLHAAYPHIKTFTLVSILDWRSEEHEVEMSTLAQALGVSILSVSLLKGRFTTEVTGVLPQHEEQPIYKSEMEIDVYALPQTAHVTYRSVDARGAVHEASYYKGSGRFSLTSEEQRTYCQQLEKLAQQLLTQRSGKRSLVLGTGEFMFVPMYIAAYLGEGVSYHSTTRSPIYAHADSVISSKYRFNSPEYPGAVNYVYNIPAHKYDDIFLIFERILDEEALRGLVGQLAPLTKRVQLVTMEAK